MASADSAALAEVNAAIGQLGRIRQALQVSGRAWGWIDGKFQPLTGELPDTSLSDVNAG